GTFLFSPILPWYLSSLFVPVYHGFIPSLRKRAKLPMQIGGFFSANTLYWQPEQRQGGNSMSLGSSLYNARKQSGLSKEEVAGKLGVSRQTISKWETDDTLPDIRQSKG